MIFRPTAEVRIGSFGHFTYEPMTAGKRLTPTIDTKRPAFEFKTGKSYFLAYQLPDATVPLDLKLRAWFQGTAFFPSLLFLDKDFAEVRFVTSPEVHNVEPGFIERGHIEANTRIEVGDFAKYMVVLTTDADMKRAKYSQAESTAYVSGKVVSFIPGGAYANDFGPTGSLTIDLTPAK
jgi:maltose operon protein